MKASITRQLGEMRRMRKMTIDELSRRTGVAVSTISIYENEKGNPTAETIERIADALDCEVRVLPNYD